MPPDWLPQGMDFTKPSDLTTMLVNRLTVPNMRYGHPAELGGRCAVRTRRFCDPSAHQMLVPSGPCRSLQAVQNASSAGAGACCSRQPRSRLVNGAAVNGSFTAP